MCLFVIVVVGGVGLAWHVAWLAGCLAVVVVVWRLGLDAWCFVNRNIANMALVVWLGMTWRGDAWGMWVHAVAL